MARARLARVGSMLGWRSVAADAVLILAAGVASVAAAPVAVPVAAAAPAGAGTAAGAGTVAGVGTAAGGAGKTAGQAGDACGRAAGPFRVSGTQVLGAGGKPFVSYGLTVAGLQGPDWASSFLLDRAEIAATADQWCANTVRLQLNQDDLLGPDGASFSPAYLAAILP